MSDDRLVRSPAGVLAAVAPVSDGVALVTGVRLNPGYWEELDQVREARELYARVGVLVDVQRQRVWLTILGLVLLIALGAAVLARALAGGMTRPLSSLASALARVEAGGSQAPLAETGPRELASLATTFNAMTARLAEARGALARAEREAAWARRDPHAGARDQEPAHADVAVDPPPAETLRAGARVGTAAVREPGRAAARDRPPDADGGLVRSTRACPSRARSLTVGASAPAASCTSRRTWCCA
jgi:HAMP domain-containing protein